MKTCLKIALLAVTLALMSGCSAQKRAERRIRQAVSLCPELVQVRAHAIDTTLTVGPWADCAVLPLANATCGDTLYSATTHGTVIVSMDTADSTLRVGFVAAPQTVRYSDTVRYAQVVVTPDMEQSAKRVNFWRTFALTLLGAVALTAFLIFAAVKLKIVK